MADPLEKQPGEPELWYQRFLVYCHMGSCRSVRNLHRKMASADSALADTDSEYRKWNKYAKKWKWRSRALAWDESRILQATGQMLTHTPIALAEFVLAARVVLKDKLKTATLDQAFEWTKYVHATLASESYRKYAEHLQSMDEDPSDDEDDGQHSDAQ